MLRKVQRRKNAGNAFDSEGVGRSSLENPELGKTKSKAIK